MVLNIYTWKNVSSKTRALALSFHCQLLLPVQTHLLPALSCHLLIWPLRLELQPSKNSHLQWSERLKNLLHLDSQHLSPIQFVKVENKRCSFQICFSSHRTHFIQLLSCEPHLKARKPCNHSSFPSHCLESQTFKYFIWLFELFYIYYLMCLLYNCVYWCTSNFYDMVGLYTIFWSSLVASIFFLSGVILCILGTLTFSQLFVHQALIPTKAPCHVVGNRAWF